MHESDLRAREYTIRWPRLIRGILLRRYQRFKADVKLRNGHVVTAHCPNSGSMLGCSEPGRPVYLSRQDRPGRKLKYTWEMIEMPTSLIGINTMVPNRLGKEAVINKEVEALSGYRKVRNEVKYGQELKKAEKNGVEIMVYDVAMDLEGISLNQQLPYEL